MHFWQRQCKMACNLLTVILMFQDVFGYEIDIQHCLSVRGVDSAVASTARCSALDGSPTTCGVRAKKNLCMYHGRIHRTCYEFYKSIPPVHSVSLRLLSAAYLYRGLMDMDHGLVHRQCTKGLDQRRRCGK